MSSAHTRMSVRIYQLLLSGSGFSNEAIDYPDTSYYVAASSTREAYYCAYQGTWTRGPERPSGIVEIYARGVAGEGWRRLWCGCHVVGGLGVNHGDGVRLLKAAMLRHLEDEHPRSRRIIGLHVEDNDCPDHR
jgi:hypothetical protein